MNAIDERGDECLPDLGLRRLPHVQHKDVSSDRDYPTLHLGFPLVILNRRRIRLLSIALRIQQAAHRRVDRYFLALDHQFQIRKGIVVADNTLPHGALEEEIFLTKNHPSTHGKVPARS